LDNQEVVELFEKAASGEISYNDLMRDLDVGGFDGDVLEFL
jgi:hypothetical protein